MISRIWHGWTDPANADAYEDMLRSVVLPEISERVNGYLGVYLLRRDHGQEVEFVTVTMFATFDAVCAPLHPGHRHLAPAHKRA